MLSGSWNKQTNCLFRDVPYYIILRYTFNIVQFSKNNENKDRPLISEAYFHYYHHKELHAFYLLQHSLILSQVFMFVLSSCRFLLIFTLQNVNQQFIPNN